MESEIQQFQQQDQSQQNFSYRHYRNELPQVEELVIVEVTDVQSTGAYVKLLEYSDRQGLIAPKEYTKMASLKAVNKAMRKGRQEVVVVMAVDYQKGFIDLSKKRVSAEETNQATRRYTKSKSVHSIVRNVAQQFESKAQEIMDYIYDKIVWPFYEGKYEHALDVFQMAVEDNSIILNIPNTDPDVKAKLLKEIQRRLTPQQLMIRADFELSCFTYEGIDAIKSSLITAMQNNQQVKFQVISAPLYIAYINCQDKNQGISSINQALSQVKSSIEAKKGTFLIKEQPRLIGDKADKDLQQLLANLTLLKNQKQEGEEEEEEDGMDIELDDVDVDKIDKMEQKLKEINEEEYQLQNKSKS